MNVAFACPKCERTVRKDATEQTHSATCPYCDYELKFTGTPTSDSSLDSCLVCGGKELFVRKDFSQRLGLSIIVIGFIASSVAWYYHLVITTFAILGVTALLDVILFFCVGNVLQCYRCRSEYRQIDKLDDHDWFSLETHERYRQEAARLKENNGVGPTATGA